MFDKQRLKISLDQGWFLDSITAFYLTDCLSCSFSLSGTPTFSCHSLYLSFIWKIKSIPKCSKMKTVTAFHVVPDRLFSFHRVLGLATFRFRGDSACYSLFNPPVPSCVFHICLETQKDKYKYKTMIKGCQLTKGHIQIQRWRLLQSV